MTEICLVCVCVCVSVLALLTEIFHSDPQVAL